MEMIEGKKRAPEHLGRVLVLGLGVSGKACVEYLLAALGTRVDALCVAAGPADEETAQWAEQARARGACVLFDHEHVEGSYDLCIASPGISQFSDFYRSAEAACAEVISEVEFAWRESPRDARWVAITGTNGKTTTTALCAHLLRACGRCARAVGNIGDTCVEALSDPHVEVFVAEVSSYQLASTRFFAPDVAVVLNITPDHLSWHKSHENYAQAKWKVLANLADNPSSTAVLNATCDEVRARIRQLKSLDAHERGFAYVPLGTARGIDCDMREACGSENAAFVGADGRLHVAFGERDIALARTCDMQLKGAHNMENALAAASAALALGADEAELACALASFAPLEHRIEPAGEVNGVACYNDSKATNVDAVLKALAAFEPQRPIILLGGRDKKTDLGELVRACARHAQAVVCFGEAKERFFEAFSPLGSQGITVLAAEHMEDALDAALGVARAGDVVVLSPACASFDEFSCFEQRGEVFKALVAERARRNAR